MPDYYQYAPPKAPSTERSGSSFGVQPEALRTKYSNQAAMLADTEPAGASSTTVDNIVTSTSVSPINKVVMPSREGRIYVLDVIGELTQRGVNTGS